MPINIVGDDGSETPEEVFESRAQSGGQAAAEAAETAEAAAGTPVQPEWMTDAAEEPEPPEAEAASVAATDVAPEPDAAYGGPITAADAVLPEFPMDTAPTKKLAVKPQKEQQQASAPGVGGVGPTSVAGGQIIAKAGELANAAANAAAIAKNMEAATAAAAEIAAANAAANTAANKAAYAAPTNPLLGDEGPASKGAGGVRVTPSAKHPDDSLVEYCRDGLMNADGTVCCSSECEFCGESPIESDNGDCSVDQIEGSNEVCMSSSDVKCIMPDNCGEDKCLLECAYNTGCEVVWRRRDWTSHPKAIALRSTEAKPPAAASRRDAARGAGVRRVNPQRNLVKVF